MVFSAEQRAEMQRRYEAGEASTVIAKDFDAWGSDVIRALRSDGVRIRKQSERPDLCLSKEQRDFIFWLFSLGLRTAEIAWWAMTTSGAVSVTLRRDFGVEKRPSVKRKKLSEEARAEIARRYVSDRATYVELEAAFGVKSSVIKSALEEHDVLPRTGWAKYKAVRYTDARGREWVFKSKWELAYARHLDAMGADWEYESVRYLLKECRRYTPDFVVKGPSGAVQRLVEIHGWLDERTEKKLREFVAMYPDAVLEILGPGEMAAGGLIEAWYVDHPMAAKMTALRSQLQRHNHVQRLPDHMVH